MRKLDGDKFTLVFFEITDTDPALVGGGPEYFVVSITMDDNIHMLMNDKQGKSEISLVIGGHLGFSGCKHQILCEIVLKELE
ncbi:hypothetical protein [Paenibacillus sp. FSL K6-0108]|uniref:hypothetical protein n=1 Tax=Paenibacillus sp. FSL K6-0108 TaxID=2921417 RepID=UPI00324C14DF